MLIPSAPETLTLYLDRDFVLTYSVGLDLSVNGGCTLTSDIVNENGLVVASFAMAVLTTSSAIATPPLGLSTFSRTLTRAAMAAAGVQPNLRYKTDIAVTGYSGVGLVDPLTAVGYVSVKPTATGPL